MASYSRLIGADEEGTLDRLKAHWRELVDPKIKEHRGRIVKTTGDGMLAEFPSVVDAIRCAVEIQKGMADRNADPPEAKRFLPLAEKHAFTGRWRAGFSNDRRPRRLFLTSDRK